ncbi:MAG: MscL family protein, partial [Candidatus Bathyarchaeia archaeon]
RYLHCEGEIKIDLNRSKASHHKQTPTAKPHEPPNNSTNIAALYALLKFSKLLPMTNVKSMVCRLKGGECMSKPKAKDEEILEVLKEIKALLEPKPPPPPPPPPKGLWKEFMDFISKYKVMGMAVAFILGLYLGALVQALVNDIIMPIITLVLPGVEWEAFVLGPFRIGHFIGALITFLLVAFVVFLIVKVTKKWGIE